jgi:hypothetical protein
MIAGAVAANVAARRNRERAHQAQQHRVSVDGVEEDLVTLRSMFPGYDDEVLFMMLQQNSYQLTPTIEMLLSMGPVEKSSESAPPVAETTTPSYANAIFTLDDEDSATHAAQGSNVAESTSTDTNANREPYDVEEYVITDEQLAYMLQNDALFQQELAMYFGEDFMMSEYMQRATVRTAPRNHTTVSRTVNGVPVNPHTNASKSRTNSKDSDDLGVVKGLTELGTEMRKQLSNFTLRYMNKPSTSGASNKPSGAWYSNGSRSQGDMTVSNNVEMTEMTANKAGDDMYDYTSPTESTAVSNGRSKFITGNSASLGVSGHSNHSSDDFDEEEDDLETVNLLGNTNPMHPNHTWATAPPAARAKNRTGEPSIWDNMVGKNDNEL